MGNDDDGSSLITKLVICLIAAASAAVIVTVYHCITTGHILTLILRRLPGSTSVQPQPGPQPSHHQEQEDETQLQSSIENSLAELIPSHKYQKTGGGEGLVDHHDEDGMCAVCLSDFEEGEILRTLPECMHSYHAPCIDMWLYSHSNCPMCRYAVAAPSTSTSPQMLLHFVESVTNLETPPSLPRPPPLPLQQHMPATRHNFRV